MGARILMTGADIGMKIGTINNAITILEYITANNLIDYPNVPGMGNPAIALKQLKDAKKDLEYAIKHNNIGQSQNLFEDDKLDLTNIFASWLSKTE